MNGIEKQAAFYRGYLIDDRSLAPLTTVLAAIAGLSLLVYAVSAIGGPEANQQMIQVLTHGSPSHPARSPWP
jgi:hypothetical protein